LTDIERFHARGQHTCTVFTGTKESANTRKELTGLVWLTNMAAASLFWNTNMAAVTSREWSIRGTPVLTH